MKINVEERTEGGVCIEKYLLRNEYVYEIEGEEYKGRVEYRYVGECDERDWSKENIIQFKCSYGVCQIVFTASLCRGLTGVNMDNHIDAEYIYPYVLKNMPKTIISAFGYMSYDEHVAYIEDAYACEMRITISGIDLVVRIVANEETFVRMFSEMEERRKTENIKICKYKIKVKYGNTSLYKTQIDKLGVGDILFMDKNLFNSKGEGRVGICGISCDVELNKDDNTAHTLRVKRINKGNVYDAS